MVLVHLLAYQNLLQKEKDPRHAPADKCIAYFLQDLHHQSKAPESYFFSSAYAHKHRVPSQSALQDQWSQMRRYHNRSYLQNFSLHCNLPSMDIAPKPMMQRESDLLA